MGIHLFAKKVYDEDLCFIRDLIEMGSAIASVTSIPVMRQVIKDVISRHGLEHKLEEFAENGHYIIKDVYPSNRQKRIERAKELLSLHRGLSLSSKETGLIMYHAYCCVKKMNFSHDEKIQLIKGNLYSPIGNAEIDNYMISTYLENL